MQVIEVAGLFAPARLADELRHAGVDCAGVTCTEDDDGNVIAVQIICGSGSGSDPDPDDPDVGVDPDVVALVCGAHDPHAAEHPTAEAIVAAAEQLRAIRDDWLNQTQPVFTEIKSPGVQDLSAKMIAGIGANSAAWLTWRERMRDLPNLLDLDFVAAAAAGAELRSTSDAWPAPWPAPPAAPVIRRR